MVYLGEGTPADYASTDVKGKIVVIEHPRAYFPFHYLRDSTYEPPDGRVYWPQVPRVDSYFEYDPEGWFPPDYTHKLFFPRERIFMAIAAGAAGFVGICVDYFNSPPQYFGPYDGIMKPLSGLYVGGDDGVILRDILTTEENVQGTLVLDGNMVPDYTYNVIGWLPGRTDDIIIVHSHHDGSHGPAAVEDASGISEVLALAKYFGQIPRHCREKTLLFLATAGHMYGSIGSDGFVHHYKELLDEKVIVDIALEHIYPREYLTIGNEFVPQDHPTAQGIFVRDNPCLLSYTVEAIIDHDLKGVFVTHGPPISDAGAFYGAGYPIISMVSGPEYLFDNLYDTPDKIMVEYLNPVASAFVDIINRIDDTPKSLIRNNPPIISPPIELYLGYGRISADEYYRGEGALYITEDVIYIGIEESGWISWDIYYHRSWGNHEYYKGKNDLGKICIYINKQRNYVVAFGCEAWFFGYKV